MPGNHNSGRRPTPLGVYAAEGRNPSRELRAVPKSSSMPTKPKRMKAEESRLWDLVVSRRSAWVSAEDAPMLRSMCEYWGLFRAAMKELREEPGDKNLRIAVNQYFQHFHTISSKFGLSPMDRARDSSVDVADVEEDKFLA